MSGTYSRDDADMRTYVFVRRAKRDRINGIVSSYISCLGAGYIDGEDGVRYFVQDRDFSSLNGPLTVGTRVTFLPAGLEGRKPHADEVKLTGQPERNRVVS